MAHLRRHPLRHPFLVSFLPTCRLGWPHLCIHPSRQGVQASISEHPRHLRALAHRLARRHSLVAARSASKSSQPDGAAAELGRHGRKSSRFGSLARIVAAHFPWEAEARGVCAFSVLDNADADADD
eukprot:5782776-Pleurochrysis_carterae.AAC.4